MPRRIAQSTLNASTLDILNVIRQNASYDYQQAVPKVTKATDIPKVGEIIYGTPALANQFINALVNRIAMVRVQSATFNNPYRVLKGGYIEFGETIEDIFVSIAQVVEYTPEKGEEREFKRTLPDIKSVFHIMNWRTMYPVTIQDNDLKLAFLSIDGVENLIAKIVDQVYTAAEYDEFLLFKYMLIKAISHGKMYPQGVDISTMNNAAVEFRAWSNQLQFISPEHNEAHVKNNTPRDRQVIFMDSTFNAKYDVNVLAAAFNMDKATFTGRLFLIDSWTTFDQDRFRTIMENSDMIEPVTANELELMAGVHAVILDERWFQVYDNLTKFTEKYVASGLYWNYFYHTWKTISHSPFANAVVFVDSTETTTVPATFTVSIESVSDSPEATVICLDSQADGPSFEPSSVQFTQSADLTKAGIAVQKYGALIIPSGQFATQIELKATINEQAYKGSTKITASSPVGTSVTMVKNTSSVAAYAVAYADTASSRKSAKKK